MDLIGSSFVTAGDPQPAPETYIRNTLTNRQLHKKAYLIEFYGDDPNKAEDVFTFSLPPESEELGYTQRKSETKTFGGMHVDEYGIDAAKIILSGSTVNQSLKLIYRPDKESKWLSGEEEIYYLRDLIKKYRSIDNLRKNAKGRIVIFDLSKVPDRNKTDSLIKNYWQAFPGDFKIRRASDRPFTYKYSFEFTGVSLEEAQDFNSHGETPELTQEILGSSTSSKGKSLESSIENSMGNEYIPVKKMNLQSLMDGLIAALDFIDGINAWVNNVLDYVNQISKLLKVLGNVMSYATNTLSGIVDSVGDTAVGIIDGTTSVVNGANSIVSLPRTIQLKALNVGLEVMNATNGLMKATATLTKNCRNMFSEDGEYWEIPQEVLDQYAMNNEEFKDSIDVMLDQAENISNEMAAAAKSSSIPYVSISNPNPETGAQSIVLSYGNTIAMLKSTDTLESLANKYYGDPDKAIDIATYNSVASLNDLKPGDIIRIPITTRNQKMKNNLIFARREDRDNYGRDILLTDKGFIVPSTSGDYELTSGVDNLSQAVILRLRESVAKRIRVNAYGIRTNISDPTAGKAYILSSIELTVSSDPRVSSVDNIRFTGRGDSMNVTVFYSDINSASGIAAGRV
jgi:hypothetical protein